MRQRLRSGIFLAPFHPITESTTSTLGHDMELIELLDHLGYDEAWIGEHHSGGFEIIGSPEIFMAAAAERTKYIKLAAGVVSLPYHSPMMVAERITLLDHLTRGRVILGVGSGVLASDASMFGTTKTDQRRRMQDSLGVIMRLLSGDTVTMETDWFVLRQARLQLPPFSDPHVEVAISASRTPVAAQLAGKYGLGMLSITSTSDSALKGILDSWKMAEGIARRAGKQLDRRRLRICSFMHVAETREKAFENVKFGLDAWCRYLAEAGGFAIVPANVTDAARYLVENQLAVIGTPEDAIQHIKRLYQAGDFGVHLVFAHDWANWEETKRSYELIARFVMPHFNNGLDARCAAYDSNFRNHASHHAAFEPNQLDRNKTSRFGNLAAYTRKITKAARLLDLHFGSK